MIDAEICIAGHTNLYDMGKIRFGIWFMRGQKIHVLYIKLFCILPSILLLEKLLSFMRIELSMEPPDRWNMSFSFFGKPYLCLQHAIIQCLLGWDLFQTLCEALFGGPSFLSIVLS